MNLFDKLSSFTEIFNYKKKFDNKLKYDNIFRDYINGFLSFSNYFNFNLTIKEILLDCDRELSRKLFQTQNNLNFINLNEDNSLKSYQYLIFTCCFIGLCASLIEVDKVANKKEIESLIEDFNLSSDKVNIVTNLFFSASQLNLLKEYYLQKLMKYFSHDYDLLRHLINKFVKIAIVDDFLSNSETKWLLEVGKIMGFWHEKIYDLIRYHLNLMSFDPEKILGLNCSNLTIAELSRNYRQYINLYHPDKLSSYDISREYLELTNQRFQIITQIYKLARK